MCFSALLTSGSSFGREPSSSRPRGTEAEREGMMENDIFRPSFSDMVANDLFELWVEATADG